MDSKNRTCTVEGCSKPLKSRGYCTGHYKSIIDRPKIKQKKIEETKAARQEVINRKISENASKFTPEQLERILLTPCRTEKDLKNFIRYFFNLHLPDCKVSRYADTTPFHAVWDVYDICTNNNNPQNIQELLYVAGRGSGKCVSQDTVIITNSGTKYVQNVKVGDLVWTGWSWKPVVETFDEGIKDGVTITTKHLTKDGAWSLTGSLKHRVQALDPETGKIDWVYMKNLIPGQLIYRSLESLGALVDTSSNDYELGWLVGCITGDGSVSRFDNAISFAAKDKDQLAIYIDTIVKHFGVEPKVKYDKRSPNLSIAGICSKALREYCDSIIEGELCYFKKLKTLNHSPSFLAGFISGMMETDGSKDSITLANPELIKQIAQILNLFGVHAVINKKRRKPSTTKFVKDHVVEYHCVDYKTALPEYLMPLFSKREAFKIYSAKMNEQFRYPSKLLKPFASFIKDKYEIANGYWRLEAGKKTHSDIKYSKDLWGSGEKAKELYVYGYKIDYFIDLAKRLEEYDWADYLSFVRRGCYETVDSVAFGKHYFYDLEVDVDHAYWSNGFISHNTLGMAIAELLVLMHDQRDVVHVGAILSQAKRCYEYQQKFLLSDRIKPIVNPPKVSEENKILEKMTMEKSVFNIKSEKVTLEVLPCTLRACLVSSATSTDVHGTIRSLADFKPGDFIKDTTGFVEVLGNELEDAECIRIELEDGRVIEGTLDHKVWTQRGWIELQHLTDADEISSLESTSTRAHAEVKA
jgi:intein/homing endonuclease